MFKGTLIVVTGLDGSGTTSLCKALAQSDSKGVFFRTPNGVFDTHRSDFTAALHGQDPAAHYLYYLAAIVSASNRLRDLLTNSNVYCNRYLIDTVVSHRVAGLDVDLNYDLGFATIVQPDLTLFVDLDEATRQRRIGSRGKSVLDKTLDCDDFRDRFKREFDRLDSTYSRISNNGDFANCYQSALALVRRVTHQ